MKNSLKLRSFDLSDTLSVMKIYNYYIKNGLANFEEKEISYDKFFKNVKKILNSKLPFIVCEENNKILGFVYLTNFRNKSGYKYSFENSIYIDKNYTNKGIGKKLLKNLIEVSKMNKKIKSIIAVIGDYKSKGSIKIHKENGFKIIGTLKKVGYKKNKWLDAIYMQLILDEKN
tara:strand:+ start:66 stop:584 length:519 start_codon:yes stop_codon:yes gene_type:complete